jgi:hypothetical protein
MADLGDGPILMQVHKSNLLFPPIPRQAHRIVATGVWVGHSGWKILQWGPYRFDDVIAHFLRREN